MSKKQEELTDNLNEFIHDSAENSQLPKRVSGDHNAAFLESIAHRPVTVRSHGRRTSPTY
jgi:hypothetical protein